MLKLTRDNIKQSVYEIISKVTGHITEDLDNDMYLEADLGLDSIKMITLMNEIIKLVLPEQMEEFKDRYPPASLMAMQSVGDIVEIFEKWYEQAADEQAGQNKDSPGMPVLSDNDNVFHSYSEAAPVNADIKQSVYEIISKVTGHTTKHLDNDMYLEADLGLDSIKMITLMNEIIKLVPPEQMEEFKDKYPAASLMAMQSVGDIVEIFEKWKKSANIQNKNHVINSEAGSTGGKQPEYLQILNSQYPFLMCYQTISTLTISSGVMIYGELNITCLKDAWKELIFRHPSLRVMFEKLPGAKSFKGYSQKVLNNFLLPDIPVEDVRYLNNSEHEQFLKETYEKSLNHKFDLFSWPLHKITVIRTGDRSYNLILSIIHLISDGLGNQQILKELLEIYAAKLDGRMADLPPAVLVPGYNDLVKDMNSWNSTEENSALESYLRQQGKEKYFFNPSDKKLDLPEPFTPIKTKVKKYWINETVTKKFILNTKVWHVSLFVLLVSAYLKTIKQLEESTEKIIINLPTGGRVYPNADATGILGSFAQNMALTFYVESDTETWKDLIERVNTEIKSRLASGIDRAQTYQAAFAAKENEMLIDGEIPETVASIIRSSVKSNLYLSFVGNTYIKELYGSLEVRDYEAYTCTNPGTIDILVELFHGRILLTSNYDSTFFDEAYIDVHMNRLVDNINELAEVSEENGEVSQTVLTPVTCSKEVEAELCRIAGEICQREFRNFDLDKDIDSELGIDSLERIRIVARLSKVKKNLDRKSLFNCRTLREMSWLLDENITSANGKNDKTNIQIPYLKVVEQCRLTPDAQAVLFEEQSISYSELEHITNKLANCLKSKGIGRGTIVGIMTLPGPMMILGMLGILKSGAAYVPVDASYPTGRIQYIINHSELNVLLTEETLAEQVKGLIKDCPGIKSLIFLDNLTKRQEFQSIGLVEKDAWMAFPAIQPEYESSPDDLMVVLYTSGSTGNPKGVMLNHLGYMNRLEWHQKKFNLKPGERVAQKTSCCFDISVWELYWPLMYGGTLCPVRKEIVRNPWELAQWLIDTKINIMHFVPSLFGEFVHALEDEDYYFKDLRWLIFSGEALPMSYIQEWIDKHGMSTKLANLYGPTEASIDVTYHIIDKRPGSDGESQIPIGKPIDNVNILNLDENMRMLSEGEIGELWIGGIQLAKGYLKNPEKTAEAFKPNPFKEIQGDYLYRTGDLTKKRADGSFEYHGRIDNQVKIRGFRVELGEIETVLSSHCNINEAAVIAVESSEGQSQLVAYLSGKMTADSEIKDYIGNKLPYYMIPHRIEWVQSLPKNPNGKLDRRAVKELYFNKSGGAREIEPLTAPVKKESPQAGNNEEKEVFIPLAPAQNWLMSYFDYPYNWTGYTRFLFKQSLDYCAFNKAITMLTNRHDALRSILCRKGSRWVQKILPQGEYINVEYLDASHMNKKQIDDAVNALIRDTIQVFSVDKWPLWKIIAIKTPDNLHDMVIVGHHLISDVVTNSLLFKELWQIYYHLLSEEKIKLQTPGSFREFVELVESEKSRKWKEYIDYWTKMFPSKEQIFSIPTDFAPGSNDEGSADTEKFVLDNMQTAKILSNAKKFFCSNVYSILLAPLYKMLGEQYRQSKVIVSHRVHGRDVGGDNTFFQTAGNFAVNFPLGIEIDQNENWASLVEKIKGTLKKVPMNGISYDVVSENLPVYMCPDIKLTPVRANYLGNRDVPQFDVFEFYKNGKDRRYSLPQQKRISIIEFFFSIVDGSLNVEIEYSRNLYSADTIKQLGEKYMESLKMLIGFVEGVSCDKNKTVNNSKYSKGLLSDKVVIVTGGGRGIGRSIALSMAREGAEIVIVSRTKEDLEQTAGEIQKLGGRPMIIPVDVTKLSDVNSAVEKILREFGRIDVLVNNAGITKLAAINDIEPDEWRKIIEVNLFGTYNFCKAVIPHFTKRNQGKIINIGSDSSFIGYPLMSAYSASKHAVLGLTKSLAEELKLQNVQVNAICPALVDTGMAPKALRNGAIPPEKISDTAVFLASSMSDYITGEAIKVYGKQDMYWFGSRQTDMFKTILQDKRNVT
ncbi:MAG: amino acid adenylation domain-containing protein [Clostridia bacterium]|nr:amino acid adenylation domain-containing protein [Clostridia bacterium]